jgi:L-amino acid N-acyltransferase YncA
MSDNLSYSISPVEPSELNFVLSSAKRSLREAHADMRTDAFFTYAGAVWDEILSRFPLMLAARTKDGVVLGWIACESSEEALTIFYTYVKSPYRRTGISKALLAAAIDASPDAGTKNLFTFKTRNSYLFERLGFVYTPIGRYVRGAA